MASQRSFLDPAVLARLMALPLNARHAMLGSVSGKHRSPIRGSSLEFAQYRKYVPGDDTRRLDWRTWGRTDRFYIKEFEADTNLRLHLLLDTSGSMNFGTTGITRLAYAQKLASTLAYLAAKQGDAAGLFCMQKQMRHLPARRGATHLGLLLDQVAEVKASEETTLAEALHTIAETIPQRGLIVILSDFFCPTSELRSAIQHLRFRKHDVAAFHLLDPQEIHFTFERPARFVDMEGGPAVLADPAVITQKYLAAFSAYLQEMDEIVRTSALDYHRVSLDQSYEAVLSRFLLGRAAKGGRK